ncbi:hypothetical protein ACIBG7_28445 [Nonomuraea sp. NPDC050328]|uniref:hypothetical protein n=1 Tax=Nonomuraea sp. NPDC050328 TaxID=3364361 RepID=UPI003788A6A4
MGFLYRAVVTAAVLVAGVAGPAAADVDISPYKVEPGDSVRITVDYDFGPDCGDSECGDDECGDSGCGDDECGVAELIAESEAFEEEGVVLRDRGDVAVGRADIDWDAEPGRYDVEVSCDGGSYVDSGTLIVVGGWGPDTGGGGLALTARDTATATNAATSAEPAGVPGALLAGGGALLLLAGAAAGSVIVVRRRARGRG